MNPLEQHFEQYRTKTIGHDAVFETPYGMKRMVYADWIASGRLYAPIEQKMTELFGPMVGNTHSESSQTGRTTTQAYHHAQWLIKRHVNASPDDAIITTGPGMTSVLIKLQRILGLKVPERCDEYCEPVRIRPGKRPVVFITHLEHHSNHTSWLETLAEVVVLTPDENLLVRPQSLEEALAKYADRPLKIDSFSACSNVTGLMPDVHELARIMHRHGGYCFVDFAASAPYVHIDMHPPDPSARLDAIFFSPHKFLGGPGSSGVLVFNKELYQNKTPDIPGGGTVSWTNRWNEYRYVDDIEAREDGGTPAFLQTIRAALAIRLKEQMGVEAIHERERQLLAVAFPRLRAVEGLHILADGAEERIGVISFYLEKIHHNLVVRLLNDRFGVQVRGGCSCAGTYGHFLLQVNFEMSQRITQMIDQGDLSLKPGWVRLSLHPTMTDAELDFVLDAIAQVAQNARAWGEDYDYDLHTGEFWHKALPKGHTQPDPRTWFAFP